MNACARCGARIASWRSPSPLFPASCRGCGARLAVPFGWRASLIYALLSHAALFGGVFAALMLASWRPLAAALLLMIAVDVLVRRWSPAVVMSDEDVFRTRAMAAAVLLLVLVGVIVLGALVGP